MNSKWLAYLPDFIRKKIAGRPNLQKIIANIGWLFFDKIIKMGVGLIVGVWVARYLGPEQFGALNFAIAFTALFGTIATLGLDGIVVRDIVREPSQSHEIISSAFMLKFAGGSIAFLLTLATIFIVRPAESHTHWLVGIIAAGMIFQSFDAIDLWFQSQVKSKYTVIAKNSAFIVLAASRVILISKKAPLIAFAWASLAEMMLGGVLLTLFYIKQHPLSNIRHPSFCKSIKLLNNSWPLILSGLVIAIYMKIDQIMLGQMINNEAVGIYSAAVRISEIWYVIPGVIVSSVFPTVVIAKQTNTALYLNRIKRLYSILIWTALILAIPMSFLSNQALETLYGVKYISAGPILSVHIWTAVFVFYGIGKSVFIQCENMQVYSLVCTATGAVVNVILNLLLIEKFGGIGAAVATLCAQITSALIIPSFYSRDRINVKFFFQALFTKPGAVLNG